MNQKLKNFLTKLDIEKSDISNLSSAMQGSFESNTTFSDSLFSFSSRHLHNLDFSWLDLFIIRNSLLSLMNVAPGETLPTVVSRPFAKNSNFIVSQKWAQHFCCAQRYNYLTSIIFFLDSNSLGILIVKIPVSYLALICSTFAFFGREKDLLKEDRENS